MFESLLKTPRSCTGKWKKQWNVHHQIPLQINGEINPTLKDSFLYVSFHVNHLKNEKKQNRKKKNIFLYQTGNCSPCSRIMLVLRLCRISIPSFLNSLDKGPHTGNFHPRKFRWKKMIFYFENHFLINRNLISRNAHSMCCCGCFLLMKEANEIIDIVRS